MPLLNRISSFLGKFRPAEAAPAPLTIPPELDEAREYLDSAKGFHHEIYALLRLKTKINTLASGPEAFELYKAAVGNHVGASITQKPVESLAELAKTRAIETIQSFEGGFTYDLPPPKVFGEGNHAPLTPRARSLLTACFANATVRGRSSFADLGDVMLLDFEDAELANIDDHLEYDPAMLWVEGRQGWVIDNPDARPVLELDEAFMLVGTHSWEFGHFFIEYLPRYLLAAQTGKLDWVTILIDAGMPEQHKQALRLLAPKTAGLINLHFGQTARVRRLWYATAPQYPPIYEEMNERFSWAKIAYYPPTFAALMDEMARRLAPVSRDYDGPRRVYLARKMHQHRLLQNTGELEEIAKARGFTVIYPQDLTFREQVRLIQNCDFVIGPEGSALFLTFIGKPGSHVMILNHTLTISLGIVTNILEARGIGAVVVSGPIVYQHPEYEHQSDYVIDKDFFAKTLDKWMADAGAAA